MGEEKRIIQARPPVADRGRLLSQKVPRMASYLIIVSEIIITDNDQLLSSTAPITGIK